MASNVVCSAVDRCILVTDIPYVTNDTGKLKDALEKYFGKRQNGGGDVERIICPFGASIEKALVIFESEQVLDTILKLTHQLGEDTIQVTRLPQIFIEVKGRLDDFYFSILARTMSQKLVEHLGKLLGTDHVQGTKYKLNEITGTIDQLREAEECILKAVGLAGGHTGYDVSDLTDRCVDVEGIPLVTDVPAQLIEELSVYFQRCGVELQDLLCPIKGSLSRAVVIFKSVKDRDQFLHQDDKSFFDATLDVKVLPPVFTEVIANVDKFYTKNIPRKRMEELSALMIDQFGHSFTQDGKTLSGRMGQISNAAILISNAVGLSTDDTISEAAKQTPDMKEEATGKPQEARSSGKGSEQIPSKRMDDDLQDDTTTTRIQADTSKIHTHPAATRPADGTQDVDQHNTNAPDVIQSPVQQISHPGGAANYDDQPMDRTEADKSANDFDVDDGTQTIQTSGNSDVNIPGASPPETPFKDCFITVDKMKYQYVAINNKADLQNIEKIHNVKIKVRTSTSTDDSKQFVELKAMKSSRGAKSKHEANIPKAQEEFVRLYSDILSSLKVENEPYNTNDNKKLQKVQERIKKNFPNIIMAWNKTDCVLCGEKTTVEKAIQELREAIAECETFSVDIVTFKYISKVNKGKLETLQRKYHVTVELQKDTSPDGNQQTVHIKPSKSWKKKCTDEELRKAKDEFISLYQDTFYRIKRMSVKCQGISKRNVKEAVEHTKKTFPNVIITEEGGPDEVIICAEEKVLDNVVRAFRNAAGLVAKRKLKKSNSNDVEEPDMRYEHSAQSASNDRDHKIQSSATEDLESSSSIFMTQEGLQIIVITDDITKQNVDVIVNAANKYLSHDGGVAKAISNAAGQQLQKECRAILRGDIVAIGDCVDTNSYNLNCKRVIHAVGPRYTSNPNTFKDLLSKTFSTLLFRSDVDLCAKSIAIPLISSGNYGGPKQTCAQILATAIQDFSRNTKERHLQRVYLVNNDVETTAILGKACAGIFLPKQYPADQSGPTENIKAAEKSSKFFRTSYQTSNGLEIFIESGDITQARVEVIVNAANVRLKHGRGVAGAISKAAGTRLQDECNRIMRSRQPLYLGECIMTEGYNLKCRIVHIAGPIYKDCRSDKEFFGLLKATFLSALQYVNLPVEAKEVAIPLVSSGIYGGPKQICAEALLDAIEEFNKEPTLVIKRIHLINLDDDSTEALQDVFDRKYSRGSGRSSSALAIPDHAVDSKPQPSIDIRVVQGDITKQDVDVIVNPTDTHMINNIGAAKAISTAAGYKYQERCKYVMKARRYKPLLTGEVIETAGFMLKSNHILHTPSPPYYPSIDKQKYHGTLVDIFKTCLRMGDTLGTSIAIPLIGAGNLGAPKELCANALATAIKKFDDSLNPKNLKTVVIISIDKEAILAAQMTIKDHFGKPDSKEETRIKEPFADDAPPTGKFQTDEGIVILNSLGDIATQQTDVMISCTDERLNHKDGVSSSISKAAGPELQREYKELIKKRKRNLKPGEMITTGGYKLQCSKVLHIIEPEIESLEAKVLEMIMFAGRTLSGKTITLPLVGSASDGSQIKRCAQVATYVVKRISRMGIPIETIHFINAGVSETLELHKVLSATLKVISGPSSKEYTDLLKSEASDTNRHLTGTPDRGSLTKGTQSNFQTPIETSLSEAQQSNMLHHGAVPKGAPQQQTILNTIQDTASAATNYLSSLVNPVVSTFYPSSPTAINSDTSASSQYRGTPAGTSSSVAPGTSSVAASGTRPATTIVTQPSQSYASAVTSNTNRTPTSITGQNRTGKTGCNKCWAQTKCKRLEGCGHMFCTDCITQYIAPGAKCLTCTALYCVTREQTLKGTMTYFIRADVNLSCQSEKGAIVIMYKFPGGMSSEHRGRAYNGNSFTAYLPNNTDGYETVCLLRNAFVAGLIFVVKSSTGGHLEVTWSRKIPHKQKIDGGIAYNGYPDMGYITRVTYALKKCGIVSSISSTEV